MAYDHRLRRSEAGIAAHKQENDSFDEPELVHGGSQVIGNLSLVAKSDIVIPAINLMGAYKNSCCF